jgi:hypothetical protein
MATRKRKRMRKRRVVKKAMQPLTKMDQHYIALRECFMAARKAGFNEEQAFWLMTDSRTMPDWVVGDGNIIPVIDPTDDEDDD